MRSVHPDPTPLLHTGELSPLHVNVFHVLIAQCGVVLGSLLLLCSAVLTLWSCQLLLKAAFAIGRFSYQSIGEGTVVLTGRLNFVVLTFLQLKSCSAMVEDCL